MVNIFYNEGKCLLILNKFLSIPDKYIILIICKVSENTYKLCGLLHKKVRKKYS